MNSELDEPKKAWYKRWWLLVLLALATLFLIMFAVVAYFVYDLLKSDYLNDLQSSVAPEPTSELILGTDSNYSLGSDTPLITIVEFSDFACPYCREAFPKIRELSQKYQNEIKLIYRDFPVIAEHSESLALAARCAGEQGLFWAMHDKLFLNQGVNEQAAIFRLAAQTGVNQADFEKCFADQRYSQDIRHDFSDGAQLGITGTPTWFINGVMIEGNIPYNILSDLIEQIIQENRTKLTE